MQNPMITVRDVVSAFAAVAIETSPNLFPENLEAAVRSINHYLSSDKRSKELGGLTLVKYTDRNDLRAKLDFFIENNVVVQEWSVADNNGDFIDLEAFSQYLILKVFGPVEDPVTQAGVMDSDEYRQSVLKTESSNFYQPEKPVVLLATINSILNNNALLDNFKKSMFYGKEFTTDVPLSPLRALNGCAQAPLSVNPRLLHGVVGLVTESVELLEQVASHMYNGTPLDMRNLYEEVGDSMYYQHLILEHLEVSAEQCMFDNDKKRMERYKGGKFTKEAAIHRDVDTELQEMTKSGNLKQ